MLDKNIFASRIKALRLSFNVPQSTLGQVLNVSKTQISDIENAKSTTSLERAYLLADYFDVSVDYLLGRTDNPKINN
ncbi:helix-turn-helix transcriptional regulator [Aminipila butyrica]|uniref:Helix-turn-helix transcriptional regulator n=1 Tax=Aminipila butyrica TaxID=433296 RepID=A0A858BXB9_9FIRM|nr:helix-turn-helix transcriptional regulator [Aminipila butyrica]QIB69758.1 helix-turn-helix transcriptional regulator [Aminipila butyrica]